MSKYEIEYTNLFKKQLSICKKRGYDLKLLEKTIEQIAQGKPLPARYKEHVLSGNWKGYWECHIRPDWLLVWKRIDDRLIIVMTATGTHSDLF